MNWADGVTHAKRADDMDVKATRDSWSGPDPAEPLCFQAAHELAQADRAYQESHRAEAHLRRALAIAPEHIEVWVGLYRFYFYRGEFEEALTWAERCLERTARELGLPPEWSQIAADERDFSDFDAAKPRFFLFALKAWGYLQMRLGRLELGRAAVAKVLELDPSDRVGASVLVNVVDRSGTDDD